MKIPGPDEFIGKFYQAKKQKTKNPQNIILTLNYSRVDKKKREETLLSSFY